MPVALKLISFPRVPTHRIEKKYDQSAPWNRVKGVARAQFRYGPRKVSRRTFIYSEGSSSLAPTNPIIRTHERERKEREKKNNVPSEQFLVIPSYSSVMNSLRLLPLRFINSNFKVQIAPAIDLEHRRLGFTFTAAHKIASMC